MESVSHNISCLPIIVELLQGEYFLCLKIVEVRIYNRTFIPLLDAVFGFMIIILDFVAFAVVIVI